VNKVDLVEDSKLQSLCLTITREFPNKEVLTVSARSGMGLEDWFERITLLNQPSSEAMPLDYQIYAEGEALLGWLNATVQANSTGGFVPDELLSTLAIGVQSRLNQESIEVAHLKMTLTPDKGLGDIAAISLVRNDLVPELSMTLPDKVNSGQLLMNLRAEAAPDQLKAAVSGALEEKTRSNPELSLQVEHIEYFRPGKPQPTYRDIFPQTA